jgi:hypothetical protein
MKSLILILVLVFCNLSWAGDREVLTLAKKVLKAAPHHPEITPELILAFAKVESSCNPRAIGDNGQARGLFQFHKLRWDEFSSKNDYYTADSEVQIQVMVKALNHYYKKKKAATCPIVWAGTYHNNGHGKVKATDYTRKLKKTLDTVSVKSYAKQ